MKIDNKKIIDIYLKTKSISETSKILDMTSQGVTWRIKKLGVFRN